MTSQYQTRKGETMDQKRLCDCVADEIIRFGDGSGPEHSIISVDAEKRTMFIELLPSGHQCTGTQQTVPVDNETLVWARPSRFDNSK